MDDEIKYSNLKVKNEEEVLNICDKASKDALLLFDLLEKYDTKEEALKEYQKIKVKKNINHDK